MVVAALGFAGWQLSRTARIAESEHLADVLKKWDEARIEEARLAANQYANKTLLLQALIDAEEHSTEEYFVLLRLPNFLEDVGNLVFDQRIVKVESVRHSLGSSIKYYWGLYEPFAQHLQEQQRERGDDATTFEAFKKLANQM